MARGYIVLELDLDEEHPAPFVPVLEDIRERLDGLPRSTSIHIALGGVGLREVVEKILAEGD